MKWYLIYNRENSNAHRHLVRKKSWTDASKYTQKYLPRNITWTIKHVPTSLVPFLKTALTWGK